MYAFHHGLIYHRGSELVNITQLSKPQFAPVSLTDVFLHLRLTPDPGSPLSHPDESMLLRHIETATRAAEAMCRRSFMPQGLRLVTSRYPHHGLELLHGPVISVDAVRYYDGANALQLVDAADYYVTGDLVPKLVITAVPAMYHRSDALRVDFTAGYAPDTSSPPATTQEDVSSNVPSEAKDAVLIGVQLLYDELTPEKRDALEKARKALLSSLTIHSVA